MTNHSERIAKNHIEATQRQLRRPDVVDALGKDAARRMLELADTLYVPTIDDQRNVKIEADGTPVVALDTGEYIHLSGETSGLTKDQRKALTQKGMSPALQDKIEASLSPGRKITMTADSGGKTVYRRGLYTASTGQEFLIRGAPLVALSTELDDRAGYDTVLAHESVHVKQMLEKPYQINQLHTKVAPEIEAYLLQAGIDSALHGPEAKTRAQSVKKAYMEWREAGHGLKTPEEKLAFETWLRERKLGVISSRISLPGVQ